MNSLTPKTEANFLKLQQLALARAVIEFGKGLEKLETEDYAEPGMKARITGVQIRHDFIGLHLGFSEFDDYNKSFEQANYWDKDGNATLTARESGFYKPQDEMYLAEENLDSIFKVVPSVEAELHACYLDERAEGQTYLSWLMAQALPPKAQVAVDVIGGARNIYSVEGQSPEDFAREVISLVRKTNSSYFAEYDSGAAFEVKPGMKMAEVVEGLQATPAPKP